MLDVETYQIVLLVGTLAGIAARTGFYFYSKQKADEALGEEPRSFAYRYLGTAGIAAALVITGGFMAYPIIEATVPNTGSLITILTASFMSSFGLNELFNKLLSGIGLPPASVRAALMSKKEKGVPYHTHLDDKVD